MKDYTTQIMAKLNDTEKIISGRQDKEKRVEMVSLLTSFASGNFSILAGVKAAHVIKELTWFFKQVTHKGPWDLKIDNSWRQTLGIQPIPAYGVKGKPNEKFKFSGKIVDREMLGNMTYGYLGKAMGFPDIILYLGGGVAAQGKSFPEMVINSAKNIGDLKPPYYGDTKEDHECIEFGIQLYKQKH